jgi:hypothetical protein
MKPSRSQSLLILKLILSCLIALALALPFISPGYGSGFLREMQMLGLGGSLVLICSFLIAVLFYCRDLQRILDAIKVENRKATPKSVWLMFVIPYNFIEDFFIMHNIAKSLKNETDDQPELGFNKAYGLRSGIGWCTAQIASLAPGALGQIAGLVALILWIFHWHFIKKCLRLLKQQQKSDG